MKKVSFFKKYFPDNLFLKLFLISTLFLIAFLILFNFMFGIPPVKFIDYFECIHYKGIYQNNRCNYNNNYDWAHDEILNPGGKYLLAPPQ